MPRIASLRHENSRRKWPPIGGHVTVDVLPEAGIFGNGHTMALEKNNKQIMYRMIAWLEGNVFKPNRIMPRAISREIYQENFPATRMSSPLL